MATKFRGEYDYALDEKGRVKIPAAFKEGLGAVEGCVLYLLRDIEECIAMYTAEEYEKLAEKLEGVSGMSRRGRQLVRRLISSVFECPVDAQGRVKLPQKLVEHAQLQKGGTITLAGFRNYVQIWNPATYLQSMEDAEGVLSEDDLELDL